MMITLSIFHSVIKQKKLQQVVTQIQDEHGVTQTDPNAIAGGFVKFYHKLLGEVEGNKKSCLYRIPEKWPHS